MWSTSTAVCPAEGTCCPMKAVHLIIMVKAAHLL